MIIYPTIFCVNLNNISEFTVKHDNKQSCVKKRKKKII